MQAARKHNRRTNALQLPLPLQTQRLTTYWVSAKACRRYNPHSHVCVPSQGGRDHPRGLQQGEHFLVIPQHTGLWAGARAVSTEGVS
jgi:hypothetical protein